MRTVSAEEYICFQFIGVVEAKLFDSKIDSLNRTQCEIVYEHC